MINNSTIEKLIEIRLGPMADAYIAQMNDNSMQDILFDDRFGMIVDIHLSGLKHQNLRKDTHFF